MHSKCHVDMITGSEVPINGVAPRALPNKPSGNPIGEEVTPAIQIHPAVSPGLRRVGPKSPMQSPSTPIISPYGHGPYVPLGVGKMSVFCCIFFLSKKIREFGTLRVFFLVFCLFFLMCFLGKSLFNKIRPPKKN